MMCVDEYLILPLQKGGSYGEKFNAFACLFVAGQKKQKGQKNENRNCFFAKLLYLLETKVAGAIIV
jgi:hypothetical protein